MFPLPEFPVAVSSADDEWLSWETILIYATGLTMIINIQHLHRHGSV